MKATVAALKAHAQQLPGCVQDIKWSADWVASVGGKMFFIASVDDSSPIGVAFKVDDHRFLELTGVPGIVPAPYLARAMWVQVKQPKALPLAELKALVTRSHALVLARLPKKLQKELQA
jgi:predicted DNA-binding protein (MmcQ/YjbR family)